MPFDEDADRREFDAADGSALPRREFVLLLAAAVALQAIAWLVISQVFVAREWGYVPTIVGDVSHYADVGLRVIFGEWPYSQFPYEYPPLSILLFLLPPLKSTLAAFHLWFGVQIILIGMVAAAVTTAAAARIWQGLERPLAAAVALAVAVVAAGAIAVDRFDGAVALVLALAVLCIVYRRWALAGLILGLGFSLKIMPIAVVPLVLVLARTRRRVFWSLLAAVLAGVVPFMPFALHDPSGIASSFLGMQVGRGLQIESVAASPFLIVQVLHHAAATVIVPPDGSYEIRAAGTALVERLAPLAVFALLAVVYCGVWRSRHALRASAEGVPVTVLAVMLATIVGNKVLSPQYLLWVLPLVALCLVGRSRLSKIAGALMMLALVLTLVEIPDLYMDLTSRYPEPQLVIAARNAALVAAFVVAVVAVWRLRGNDLESAAAPTGGRSATTTACCTSSTRSSQASASRSAARV